MQSFSKKVKTSASQFIIRDPGFSGQNHQVASILQQQRNTGTQSRTTNTIVTGENEEEKGLCFTGSNESCSDLSGLFSSNEATFLLYDAPFDSMEETGGHCVPAILSYSLPEGESLNASVHGDLFTAPFIMEAEFYSPVPCIGSTGEYRQYVSGYFEVNGSELSHSLCWNTMSRTTHYEDCLQDGGIDYRYGYHSLPFRTSKFSNPDQATGATYKGSDTPGFDLTEFSSGDELIFDLSFRGEFVDAANADCLLQPASTWSVGGMYTVP